MTTIANTGSSRSIDKIMAVISAHDGKVRKRKLCRVLNLKGKDIDKALRILEKDNVITIATVSNLRGEPTKWIYAAAIQMNNTVTNQREDSCENGTDQVELANSTARSSIRTAFLYSKVFKARFARGVMHLQKFSAKKK